jgi:hypothetical protein
MMMTRLWASVGKEVSAVLTSTGTVIGMGIDSANLG